MGGETRESHMHAEEEEEEEDAIPINQARWDTLGHNTNLYSDDYLLKICCCCCFL